MLADISNRIFQTNVNLSQSVLFVYGQQDIFYFCINPYINVFEIRETI